MRIINDQANQMKTYYRIEEDEQEAWDAGEKWCLELTIEGRLSPKHLSAGPKLFKSRAEAEAAAGKLPFAAGTWRVIEMTDEREGQFMRRACNTHDALVEACEDIDLRITQARLACTIGRKKDRTAFLLGELDRIKAVVLSALAQAQETGEPAIKH